METKDIEEKLNNLKLKIQNKTDQVETLKDEIFQLKREGMSLANERIENDYKIFKSNDSQKNVDIILSAIQGGGTMSLKEISKITNIKYANANYAVSCLVKRGNVDKVGHGKYKYND